MARVKRSVTARKRHKKILKLAKGHYGARSRVYRTAKQSVIKASQYSYRDRRNKKRTFRSLWIIRINAAARSHGLTYSELMGAIAKYELGIDRKMLAKLAMEDATAFAAIVEKVKDKSSKIAN